MLDPLPSRLNVWLCPICSEGAELQPASRPGEYELQVGDEYGDGVTRGVYITLADANACIARCQAAAEMGGTDG